MMPSTIISAIAGDTVMDLFSATRLASAAELGKAAISGGSVTAFERECDNAVSDFLSGASFVSFGPEPVAAYLSMLENEITSIRIILTAKLSGTQPEIIRERLRNCHV